MTSDDNNLVDSLINRLQLHLHNKQNPWLVVENGWS